MNQREWKRIQTELGRRIKRERERANLSLSDLAGSAGISVKRICEMESGIGCVPVRVLYVMADLFGIQVTELMAE